MWCSDLVRHGELRSAASCFQPFFFFCHPGCSPGKCAQRTCIEKLQLSHGCEIYVEKLLLPLPHLLWFQIDCRVAVLLLPLWALVQRWDLPWLCCSSGWGQALACLSLALCVGTRTWAYGCSDEAHSPNNSSPSLLCPQRKNTLNQIYKHWQVSGSCFFLNLI